MKYYLAPLEGVTTYIYRRAYHQHFRPMDKYFTPFLVPHLKKGFSTKEKNEIIPEHSPGMYLVPQIMTNCAGDFINTVEKLQIYGYQEVNLNLGCPSKTVVSKYRGAGFLGKPEELDRFLDEIFSRTPVKISVKTRIGKDSPEEFEHLLDIYRQYPMEELIIHPRIQLDFYRNRPNLDVFEKSLDKGYFPICYNGDIFCPEDHEKIRKRFPEVECMMLGRGIIMDPSLVEQLEGKSRASLNRIRQFHDQIYEDYQRQDMGDKNVLFKMKELWCYMGEMFPEQKKILKSIKKAEKKERYEEAVREILGD